MRALAMAALLSLPTTAFAVGADDPAPPTPTKTTSECKDGLIWDEDAKSCVAPKESRLDDDTLYRAAREFAYAGAFDHAIGALDAMDDQTDDRVLTYRGFTARKTGDAEAALGYYAAALEKNPDNLLARSYLGMAYIAMGDAARARAELAEIRVRGGRMTWPEIALREALRSGRLTAY